MPPKKAVAAAAKTSVEIIENGSVRVFQNGDYYDYEGAEASRAGDYLQVTMDGKLFAEFAPGHWSAWQYTSLVTVCGKE